jgi:hypothetical protein
MFNSSSLGLLVVLVASLLLSACSKSITLPETADKVAPSKFEARSIWAEVLKKYVDRDGLVDFAEIKKDPSRLEDFLRYVATVDPIKDASLFGTQEEVLAFHINAYNALAMYNVVSAGIPKKLGGTANINFFFRTKLPLMGKEMSLYDYENKIIRAANEPRVHFALNCMSASCPQLVRVPFDGVTLGRQLDFETKKFLNESRNVRLDKNKRKVYLSEILKWYKEDFLLVAPDIVTYINRYREEKIPKGYSIEYIPYDWTIISQVNSASE